MGSRAKPLDPLPFGGLPFAPGAIPDPGPRYKCCYIVHRADLFFRAVVKKLGLKRGEFEIRHVVAGSSWGGITFRTSAIFAHANFDCVFPDDPHGGYGPHAVRESACAVLVRAERVEWSAAKKKGGRVLHYSGPNHWLSTADATLERVTGLCRALERHPYAWSAASEDGITRPLGATT
jgi:hypothetical protein